MLTKPKDSPLSILNDLAPRMGVASEGWPQIGTFAVAAVVNRLVRNWIIGKPKPEDKGLKKILQRILVLLDRLVTGLTLVSLVYFRDPERLGLGQDSDYLYAPADGKVTGVSDVTEPKFIAGRAKQVTVSSNLVSVHIQRAPISGRVEYIFKEETKRGYTTYIGIRDAQGRKILLSLFTPYSIITGVFKSKLNSVRVTAGQEIKQNDKIGVAGFGWKTTTTVAVPRDLPQLETVVSSGHPVKAAMSVMARIG